MVQTVLPHEVYDDEHRLQLLLEFREGVELRAVGSCVSLLPDIVNETIERPPIRSVLLERPTSTCTFARIIKAPSVETEHNKNTTPPCNGIQNIDQLFLATQNMGSDDLGNV